MSDIHPSLAEVIKDKDREHAREQIAALVRQLQSEGKNTRAILKALFDITLDLCVELPTGKHHYDFLEYVRDSAQHGIDLFEAIIDKDENTEH